MCGLRRISANSASGWQTGPQGIDIDDPRYNRHDAPYGGVRILGLWRRIALLGTLVYLWRREALQGGGACRSRALKLNPRSDVHVFETTQLSHPNVLPTEGGGGRTGLEDRPNSCSDIRKQVPVQSYLRHPSPTCHPYGARRYRVRKPSLRPTEVRKASASTAKHRTVNNLSYP